MTKAELNEYRSLLKEIAYIKQEKTKIWEDLTAPPEMPMEKDRVQSIRKMDRTGDLISKVVDLEELYEIKLDRALEQKKAIEEAITCLDGTERQLIRLRYMDGDRALSWEKICIEMSCSWRQVHYIHSRALKKIS